MPCGFGFYGDARQAEAPVVGRPARDRSKNRAQRQARKRRR